MLKPQRKLHVRMLVKAGRSPGQVLLARCTLLLVLVATVLAIFWFDRDGLRDHYDNHISFGDVAYFTAVTITTVGYGDIVPVSDRARIVDALLVTPLRLFIWLIFLGTAYEFVLQNWLEARRMKRLQQRLHQHLIICGYGHSGQSAAREAVSRGVPATQIVIIDRDMTALARVSDDGFIGLHGDATHEEDLKAACVAGAKSVIVCVGRDDAAVLSVLTLRQLSEQVRIVCSVDEEENIKLIRQAGANTIVAPSIVGGYLMADSIDSPHIADYINDLMSSEGRVRLSERPVRADEIGKPMREIAPELVVRLHRGNARIGFWEGERAILQPGDILLVIEPNK